MPELWLPVVGYEGFYEVSDQGRVRSVERRVLHRNEKTLRTYPSRMLVPRATRYLDVTLCRGGTQRTLKVHHLVGEAFLGPRPDGLELCHNNGDALDNRAANLRYDTHSANVLDSVHMRTQVSASKTHCPDGHEYNTENTRIEVTGWRRCRICERHQKRVRRKAA